MLLELAAACTVAAPIPTDRCRCAVMSFHLTTVEAVRPFTESGQLAVIGRVIGRRESDERAPNRPPDSPVAYSVDYDVVVTASWGPGTADTIVVRSDGPWNNCHVGLVVGEELLVLSDHVSPEGRASISNCISPVAIAHAGALMALLDAAATRRHHAPAPRD